MGTYAPFLPPPGQPGVLGKVKWKCVLSSWRWAKGFLQEHYVRPRPSGIGGTGPTAAGALEWV